MNHDEKNALHEAFYKHTDSDGSVLPNYDDPNWFDFSAGFEAGKNFALPAPAVSEAPSIDTPEFREICRLVWGCKYDALLPSLKPLVAHIDQHAAAAVHARAEELARTFVRDVAAERDAALAELAEKKAFLYVRSNSLALAEVELAALRAQVPQAGAGADDERYNRLFSAFHQNMMRAYPDKTHAEIAAEIERATGGAPPAAELPALPRPAIEWQGCGAAYTADQMQDYARSALALRQPQGEHLTRIADAAENLMDVLDGYPEQLVPINRESVTVQDLRAAVAAKQAGKEGG